ncbi:YopX family protein [Cytobacillus solani]|uniref:YopX protein domain-containing protein n=1 Tax=Cytobacillus solani TaxID=1637975 RepID=A0A0Q3QSG2_9BACI|nr:YopX family protein [Cytobacillus solani]KQL20496.1 hypothetical protein AN957_19170 [Cytobacillus solani]
MREIKFRGKPIEDYGDIKWFVGSLILSCEDELAYIEADGQGTVPVEWESVGQYTCLKDKNGKEIYEGDIIALPYKRTFPELGLQNHTVIFKNGYFSCSDYNTYASEVIGNIYENPELLNIK